MNINPNQNHRILVIDDNKAIHEDFKKILGRKKAAPSNLAEGRGRLVWRQHARHFNCRNLKLIPRSKARKGSS